jgi:hypothetical protein
MFTIEVDIFKDTRDGIFMSAARRNIPSSFGAPAVAANLGKTETKGYEMELSFNQTLNNGFGYWARASITRSKDLVLESEDPELLPDYLKLAGFQIGQTKSQIRAGFNNTWDDVYASTSLESNVKKLPGDWDIIDYNCDGIISTYDNIPYGFPDRPQNTYNASMGVKYKDFSIMWQFYGVTNIHRYVSLAGPALARASVVSTYFRDYWTPDNTDAYYKAPRLATGSPSGELNLFDGSYLRLKTAEIAYNLPGNLTRLLGLTSLRFYVNGNNLFFWSDLPHDQETGSYTLENSYPTFRHINLGIDVIF